MSTDSNLVEFLRDFIAESREHLTQAESCLLHLNAHPEDEASIHACFRSLHTIKGGAGFLGLARIQNLAHAAEHLLDRMRTGGVQCSSEHVEVLLQVLSRLESILSAVESDRSGAA
jgi:two-component system chemotaxis sensor kinase CheA